MEIQEHQFQRLLQIFPVVRSRDYCHLLDWMATLCCSRSVCPSIEEDRPLSPSLDKDKDENRAQGSASGGRGAFWSKLKTLTEPNLGKEGAENFCRAFQKVHEDLVRKVPLESIDKIIKAWESKVKPL